VVYFVAERAEEVGGYDCYEEFLPGPTIPQAVEAGCGVRGPECQLK
jgi:hypothetical protein